MLNRMQRKMLSDGIEKLALEHMLFHVEKNRKLDVYTPSIVNYHKSLINNTVNETFKYDYYIYNFKTIISEKISHDSFSNADKKLINKTKNISDDITNRFSKGYIFRPRHIYETGGILHIDWKKFNLSDHIRFLKESIAHEVISIGDTNLLNGFWDGSGHIIKESKKILYEGSALGCDKKNYKFAKNVFNSTKNEVFDILEDAGFIVENVYSAGSLRRKKNLVGDIDLIVNVLGHEQIGLVENNILSERRFLDQYAWLFGNTIKRSIDSEKASTYKNITQFVKEGMQCDVFFCTPTALPTRRCYWTGSAAHNVKMMYEGYKKDILFSFDYLYDKGNKKLLKPKSEKEVFSILGMDYIPPEQRR